MKYFISGHRDLTLEEFNKYYTPVILEILEEDPTCEFVVGDYQGVDSMAQRLLENCVDRVTVYHMFDAPRNLINPNFKTIGGFTSDEERDAAMTKDSDRDIAFVRKGRRKSGTAQNIVRRYEFNSLS